MNNQNRAQWSSKLGFILAAAGSAVGLGNIWKFPGRAYEGGGGAFLVIYLFAVVLIGLPVMISEFAIGRAGGADAVGSYRKLDKRFVWLGYVSVIIPFVITAYYSHVGGWVMKYAFAYLFNAEAVYTDPTAYFYGTLGYNAATGETWFPVWALLFALLVISITAFVIIKGVESGIERFNKIGMPMLFLLLLILLVRVLTLDGAADGIRYMLSFDWSKVSAATVLSAVSQAFYSLSLGMGIMVTYGSYLKKEENIFKNSVLICSMDTLVAFIAGFIVVPACFATLGAENIGKGASFAFVSLAGVFQSLPAGWLFGAVFYLLLLFAALTSCVSLVEVLTAFTTEHLGWERKKSTIGISIVLFLIGTVYTCSQAAYNIKGFWFDFAGGLSFPTFADSLEFLTDRLMIPVCALAVAIFAGYFWKPEKVVGEIELCGTKFPCAKLYGFMIRFLAPVTVALILAISMVKGMTLS